MNKIKCPHCNQEAPATDNFCVFCSTKLKETCHCWVKKVDNYNCGESSCPGFKLHLLEKSRANNKIHYRENKEITQQKVKFEEATGQAL